MLTKKEIKKRCKFLRGQYKSRPCESFAIGYYHRHLKEDYLNNKIQAYAFKMFQDSVICPSTQKIIPMHTEFIYRNNSISKNYNLKDMLKDIINVYSDNKISSKHRYLIEVYQLKKTKKGNLNFKKIKNLNIHLSK